MDLAPSLALYLELATLVCRRRRRSLTGTQRVQRPIRVSALSHWTTLGLGHPGRHEPTCIWPHAIFVDPKFEELLLPVFVFARRYRLLSSQEYLPSITINQQPVIIVGLCSGPSSAPSSSLVASFLHVCRTLLSLMIPHSPQSSTPTAVTPTLLRNTLQTS